ncbi:MAG: phosphatase PAP2 family protein [Dehalococcoidia bacterium]
MAYGTPPARATGAGSAGTPAAGGVAPTTGSVVLLAVQSAFLAALALTVATRLWQDHVWLGWALLGICAVLALPEVRRTRQRRWWFVYVAGIFAYTLLRSYADETAIPIRTTYAIDADRLLFAGADPVTWLQGRLFSTTHTSALDVLAVAVHWSFFIAPHAAAIAIFIWRRELFPRYVTLVVATMYAGLVLFFLLPTTPPWLAGQEGALDGAYRVMDFVGGRVDAGTYRSFYASLGEPNSVAAMPSIHLAVTMAMYLWARVHAPRFAWPLLIYTAVMGAALVYLAEHYVLDLLAGAGCAVLCHYFAWKLLPTAANAALGGALVDAGPAGVEAGILRPHDHLAAADE